MKELYYIEHGSCIFRYPKSPSASEEDQSKSSLSSGLLAALQSFTFETRQGNIDFFASDNEYFMFEMFDEPGRQIVGIFDNDTDKQISRSIMSRIKNVISQSDLLSNPQGLHLSTEKDLKLQQKIRNISQGAMSVEAQQKIAEEIINEAEDDLQLLIYDLKQSNIRLNLSTHGIEPNSTDTKLIKRFIRSTDKLMGKIVSGSFEYLSVEIEDSLILMVRERNQLVIVYIQDIEFWQDIEEVQSIPLRLVGYPNFNRYRGEFTQLALQSRWRTNLFGTIEQVHGTTPNPSVEYLLDLYFQHLQNIIDMFGISEPFHNINIYVKLSKVYRIRFSRQFTTEQILIGIYT